jgi:hypothetical protein
MTCGITKRLATDRLLQTGLRFTISPSLYSRAGYRMEAMTPLDLPSVPVHSARTGGLRSRFGLRRTCHPEESQRAQVGERFAILQKVLNNFFLGGGEGALWHVTSGTILVG